MDGGRTSMASRAFVMAGVLTLLGCATHDDLEALRTQVNHSLLQTRQQMHNRLGALEDMKKKVDAQDKQLTARQAQDNRLDALESVLTRSLDQQALLSDALAAVRTAVEEKDDRLVLLLDAQEQVYQEGLRTLHAIREQFAGKQSEMRPPLSQAPDPTGALAPLMEPLDKGDVIRPKR